MARSWLCALGRHRFWEYGGSPTGEWVHCYIPYCARCGTPIRIAETNEGSDHG